MDTIFALASAPGKAGVSIIRISGFRAWDVAGALAGDLPEPRQSALRSLRGPTGDLIDQALVLSFKAPHSFTGEDIVEFHVHGSHAVIKSVLHILSLQPDARLAEPGEFTRRSLENDCLDLAQVEGLADLIDAETEAQRVQAVRVLSGALGEKVECWRRDLIRAAALLEATIDFADEDVPVDVSEEVLMLIAGVEKQLVSEVAGSHVGERIRTGFEVAIVGAPNSGKSTLLNRLAGRQAAITSEVAGTTRDIIEVRMDIGGLPITFLDTAGLRSSEDLVESIGIERAILRAKSADLRVFLLEAGESLTLQPQADDIILLPKGDLLDSGAPSVSGLTGIGVTELIENVRMHFTEKTGHSGIATHARHRVAMEQSIIALMAASDIVCKGPDFYDIASEEMRIAIRSLEVLVGRIDVDSLLDEIFSSFCLGK